MFAQSTNKSGGIMKKIIVGLLVGGLVPLAFPAQAGEVEGFIELLRSDIRSEKVAPLTVAMDMDEQQAENFWPLQRDYESSLALLNDERLKLIKLYAKQWGTLTDEQAAVIATDWFSIQERRLKLRKATYKKVTKEIGALVAARYLQIENSVQMVLDLQLASELPLLE